MKNKKTNILLTGGAGYIGSVLAHHLLEKDYNVFIIDNLIAGHVSLVPKKCIFFRGDFSSKKILKQVFKNRIDIIIHMAAHIEVEESIKKKKKYMNNNFKKFKIFLKYTNKYCKNIVFASTASVYKSKDNLIKENSITYPINPYAESKLAAENFLINYSKKKINYIILRFFNVAGAHKKLKSGLVTDKPTHLIKRLCVFAVNKKKNFSIFGNNYNTPDGTAIRDYIHVSDLCNIILLIIPKILKKRISKIFNCGYGKGFSVKEVFEKFNKLSNFKLRPKINKARKGDVKILVSDSSRIKKFLNWKPQFDNLSLILKSSIKWEKKIKQENFK